MNMTYRRRFWMTALLSGLSFSLAGSTSLLDPVPLLQRHSAVTSLKFLKVGATGALLGLKVGRAATNVYVILSNEATRPSQAQEVRLIQVRVVVPKGQALTTAQASALNTVMTLVSTACLKRSTPTLTHSLQKWINQPLPAAGKQIRLPAGVILERMASLPWESVGWAVQLEQRLSGQVPSCRMPDASAR